MIGKPALQFARNLRSRYDSRPMEVWRGVAVTSLLAMSVGGVLFYVPSPATVAAPGVVEFQNVQNLRSLTGGFVREILVVDGQQVQAGQPLLRLENLEVSTAYFDLCLALSQAEVKYQTAVDRHEATQAQVAQREIAALTEQMTETQRRFESLDVRAPQAGKVIGRAIAQMQDTYLREGAPMLSIGNEDSKEVIVAIDQRHFDSVSPFVGQPVQIRTGSQARVAGKFVRLEPRATSRLVHPALSAMEGGPLEVVQSKTNSTHASEATQLAEPCFRGVISVPSDCAIGLPSGQRANVTIGYRSEALGVTFYRATRDWIHSKLAQAGNY